MIKYVTVDKIEEIESNEDVYNLELESITPRISRVGNISLDDFVWKVADTGLFTHNCFPKDINALIYLSEKLGITPSVMKGAWEKNLEVRPERDWENLIGRAVSQASEPSEPSHNSHARFWAHIGSVASATEGDE